MEALWGLKGERGLFPGDARFPGEGGGEENEGQVWHLGSSMVARGLQYRLQYGNGGLGWCRGKRGRKQC